MKLLIVMLKAISKPITYSLENIKTIDKQ